MQSCILEYLRVERGVELKASAKTRQKPKTDEMMELWQNLGKCCAWVMSIWELVILVSILLFE